MIDAVLGAGFPRSGNSMIGVGLCTAGVLQEEDSQERYDIYKLRLSDDDIRPHVLLSEDAPCAYIKTHNPRPLVGMPHSNLINVTKVVRILRNPLDMLLSYINYTRFKAHKAALGHVNDRVNYYLTDCLGIDQAVLADPEWYRHVDLDWLKEHGHLEQALIDFSQRGMVVFPTKAFAGSWGSNILSWQNLDCPSHIAYYETFIENMPEGVAQLAAFLEVDPALLMKGFKRHKERVSEGDDRQLYYNKMTANYFGDYFERSSIRAFIDTYWALIGQCGYAEWCERAYYA